MVVRFFFFLYLVDAAVILALFQCNTILTVIEVAHLKSPLRILFRCSFEYLILISSFDAGTSI